MCRSTREVGLLCVWSCITLLGKQKCSVNTSEKTVEVKSYLTISVCSMRLYAIMFLQRNYGSHTARFYVSIWQCISAYECRYTCSLTWVWITTYYIMYEGKRFSVLHGASKIYIKQPVLAISILKKYTRNLLASNLYYIQMTWMQSSKTQYELALELREHLLIAGLPV